MSSELIVIIIFVAAGAIFFLLRRTKPASHDFHQQDRSHEDRFFGFITALDAPLSRKTWLSVIESEQDLSGSRPRTGIARETLEVAVEMPSTEARLIRENESVATLEWDCHDMSPAQIMVVADAKNKEYVTARVNELATLMSGRFITSVQDIGPPGPRPPGSTNIPKNQQTVGYIQSQPSSASLDLAVWNELISQRNDLKKLRPREGIDPFSGQRITFTVPNDTAAVNLNGETIGYVGWAQDCANQLVVSGELAVVKPIAEEIASSLGGNFRACDTLEAHT